MKDFILTHTHRHGTSVYLLRSYRELNQDDAISFLGDEFELDREDEYVDLERATPVVIR